MTIKKSHIKLLLPRLGGTAALLLLLFSGSMSSCESEDWLLSVDCNDCFNYQPDSAKLIVYLSLNEENPEIPLTFYEGLNDGEIDWQDTARGSEFYLDAKVGTTYTVKAEYKQGSKTIIAWDEDFMRISDYGDECGSPCYIIKGGIFDLRLIDN